MGRFVPPGVTDLDQSNTIVLACSKHITTRFIDNQRSESAARDAFGVKGVTLTAADARRVIDEFAMSEDKLEALKLMRDRISDPQNWQVLVDGFTYSDDREAARKLAP